MKLRINPAVISGSIIALIIAATIGIAIANNIESAIQTNEDALNFDIIKPEVKIVHRVIM